MKVPRHSKAHFAIEGRVDNAQGGRLTVDRRLGLVTVRPKGKRRTYVLPLVDVANIIVCRVVKAELPRE